MSSGQMSSSRAQMSTVFLSQVSRRDNGGGPRLSPACEDLVWRYKVRLTNDRALVDRVKQVMKGVKIIFDQRSISCLRETVGGGFSARFRTCAIFDSAVLSENFSCSLLRLVSQACSANLPLFEECLSASSAPLLPPTVHGHRHPPHPPTPTRRVH